jgi:hypothetical protein
MGVGTVMLKRASGIGAAVGMIGWLQQWQVGWVGSGLVLVKQAMVSRPCTGQELGRGRLCGGEKGRE